MQINEGEMIVTKSKNYENFYFTRSVKKDKETGEYLKDSEGNTISIFKTVYLPEGTDIGDFAKIKFKGYTGFNIREDGTTSEYISVQEILDVTTYESKKENTQNEEFQFENDDDLPF